ncbi:MAG: hypothetical protein IZT59_12520 [Verrucomicrobia bacterium]|jgi:hypothetical protein|nr:hypothetical protein [Verrucomicrobiota bacterium]|tara:strand:+ start:3453 stop:3803 length:351 start_codon:yes stop_codon:yes gene_type:complete
MPDILEHLLSQTGGMAFQNGASASAFAIVPIAAIAVIVSRDTILNPFRHSPSLLKFSALVPGSSRCLGVSEGIPQIRMFYGGNPANGGDILDKEKSGSLSFDFAESRKNKRPYLPY